MPKVTKKSRITKLLKMGLSSMQISEVTGFDSQTVRSYIWQIKNEDKVKATQKKYYQNNKSKRQAYSRKYYKRNREYINEQRREYALIYWHTVGKQKRKEQRNAA